MNQDVWEFIGTRKLVRTEADQMVTQLIHDAIESVHHFLKIEPSTFSSIHEMIDYGRARNDEHSYFWDWMHDIGLEQLQIISKHNFSDSEEMLDLLNYRQMLLDMDIENGIISNLFISISESLTTITEYIQTSLEQSVSIEVDLAEESITIPIHQHIEKQHSWVLRQNSAIKQQSFFV